MSTSLLERDLHATVAPVSDDEASSLKRLGRRFAGHFETISDALYERLPPADRTRFLIWFARRWGGVDRVPRAEMSAYVAEIERVRTYPYDNRTLDSTPYKELDLTPQGYCGKLLTYPWMLGIHDFLFDQYQHGDFKVTPGDTIIDAGAFVGDTALLFHQLTRGQCRIHAFEVLDENLKLLEHNLRSNGIAGDVSVTALALTEESGRSVNIKAPAVQGATSIFGDAEGIAVETITIDDYVVREDIPRVDLIKMDIEGAERMALEGALQTIRRDHPKLAVCIYHLWDDVIEIPKIIASSGMPYRFGFKWVELRNGWEAVLLCTPETDKAA